MRLAGRCLVVRQPAILRHDRILVPLSRRFLFLPVLRPSCTFFFSNLSSLSRTACHSRARDSLRLSLCLSLSSPRPARSFPFHTERRYIHARYTLFNRSAAFR